MCRKYGQCMYSVLSTHVPVEEKDNWKTNKQIFVLLFFSTGNEFTFVNEYMYILTNFESFLLVSPREVWKSNNH